MFSSTAARGGFSLGSPADSPEPGKGRGWGGSTLELCCVEVLHSCCHENFPELIHVIAPGDGGCEQQLFLLSVPLAVLLAVTVSGAAHTHSGQMLGDTASRQYFQAVSHSGCLAHLSWGLIFRGNKHFTQRLKWGTQKKRPLLKMLAKAFCFISALH